MNFQQGMSMWYPTSSLMVSFVTDQYPTSEARHVGVLKVNEAGEVMTSDYNELDYLVGLNLVDEGFDGCAVMREGGISIENPCPQLKALCMKRIGE